jgi:hypothetical protein
VISYIGKVVGIKEDIGYKGDSVKNISKKG